MLHNNIFTLEALTRDLAEQYAKGYLSTDQYHTVWEDITRAFAQPSNTAAI
jgi:hypothetical protein